MVITGLSKIGPTFKNCILFFGFQCCLQGFSLLGVIHLNNIQWPLRKMERSQCLPNENPLWALWFYVSDVSLASIESVSSKT